MKKLLLLGLFALPASLFAAGTDTATLTLNGSIGDVIEIEISLDNTTYNTTATNNFNLSVAGESDKSVGWMRWRTNMTGYAIAVTSANAQTLKKDATNNIPYTLKVGTDVITVGSHNLTGLTFLSSTVWTARQVLLSYLAADMAGKPAGTYTDTLTFTITAP